jgi:hypothetical protein
MVGLKGQLGIEKRFKDIDPPDDGGGEQQYDRDAD